MRVFTGDSFPSLSNLGHTVIEVSSFPIIRVVSPRGSYALVGGAYKVRHT
jgi:hypothetical protein